MVIGTIAAAVSGYLAIARLLAVVRRHSYEGFVIYRVALGVGILVVIATGLRPATFQPSRTHQKRRRATWGRGEVARRTREDFSLRGQSRARAPRPGEDPEKRPVKVL